MIAPPIVTPSSPGFPSPPNRPPSTPSAEPSRLPSAAPRVSEPSWSPPARGGLLYLQGRAEIQWHGPEVSALDGAERLWRVHVERGWRRPAALPLRWTAPAA